MYEINLLLLNLDNKFTLVNILFGAIKLTKNADSDKYFSAEYGIIFDTH